MVCGAPNVAVGQKVAYAAIGAKLIDGHTGEPTVLKAAKIRGVESGGHGLLRARAGPVGEHEGILVLPEDAPVGTPLRDYLGDTVLDLEITPNRPDLMSVLGIAWEVAAQTHTKVNEPERVYPEAAATAAAQRTSVTIEDKDLCPRYLAGIVERVKIGPSPEWMQERLRAAGMRPINNVVDITNYVMLEMGQPLHAFDFRKLGGGRIVVRRAKAGERMKTLDGVDRELTPDMLVIADAESKPVAVAGVMGGADAEVTPATTTILLEAANFDPVSVRRTSQALGLRTEASTRFEKGLHPELAADRAPRHEAARRAHRRPRRQGPRRRLPDASAPTRASSSRASASSRCWASTCRRRRCARMLTDLGFGCRWVPPDRYVVRAPYWRTDVSIADDVIEEIARIIGYDELPISQLRGRIPTRGRSRCRPCASACATLMAEAGMQEIITYSMTDLESLAKVLPREELAINRPLKLANPLSRQYEYARTTLRHALLETLAANARGSQELVCLFETARVSTSPATATSPHEVESLCGVVTGRAPDRWGQPTGEPAGFFDAKARLEHLFESLRVPAEFREAHDFAYLPGRTAEVFVGDRRSASSARCTRASAASSGSTARSRCSRSTSKRCCRTCRTSCTTRRCHRTRRWRKTWRSSCRRTCPRAARSL